MAMLLPRNDILVKYNKNSDDNVHYNISDRFDNFYFEEMILLQNISKMTDNEEFAWFFLMMSICFSFIFGIINSVYNFKT